MWRLNYVSECSSCKCFSLFKIFIIKLYITNASDHKGHSIYIYAAQTIYVLSIDCYDIEFRCSIYL